MASTQTPIGSPGTGDKVYIVTLHSYDDLEGFYSDMSSDGYRLHMKRPISRNTQYWMTSAQAEVISADPRVLACEERYTDIPGVVTQPFNLETNNTEYNIPPTTFRKDGTFVSNDRQWGHLHVAGDTSQRRKGSWGGGSVTDQLEIFNDGAHVDIVIVDNPVSIDCAEWLSPTTGLSRFVQYDWFNELNQYVSTIDDDGETIPSGSYLATGNYVPNASNVTYHGTHVCGTAAGKWYGWAPEANIYSLQVNLSSGQGNPVSSLLVFDYLRAFHRHKPINPVTGKRNPTVTNHSWGATYGFNGDNISQYAWVEYRGVTYDSANPNPSGWTLAGLEADFGIGANKYGYDYDSVGSRIDAEDAVNDGVVVIGAAGNNNQYACHSDPSHPSYVDYDNKVSFTGIGWIHLNRGSSPNNAKSVITVGNTGKSKDFERRYSSNYGPVLDVWAPGAYIVSAYNSGGTLDGKYGGDNYFWRISGTSMASPQVAGVAACLATGKERFTNSDVIAFIQQHGLYGDMTFNSAGGSMSDTTCDGSGAMQYFANDAPELRCTNPRPISGIVDGWYKETLKGHRRHEEVPNFGNVQLYPRTNTYYRPIAQELNKNFPISVTNNGSTEYIINGDDRSTTHVDSANATINVKKGDTITFTLNAATHPFWISITQSTGQPSSGLQPSGVTNNGDDVGTITWNTTGNLTGTYYYNCEHHGGMTGQIFVNQ